MARVEKTIEVERPLGMVYNQWTQFEEFPSFMDGVREVKQLDDRRLHWRAEIAGKEREWDAEIREQIPDERVIWMNTSGTMNAGQVSFEPMGPDRTRVHLEMSYEPEGALETAGEALGFLERQVDGDLKHFKEYIEHRVQETGSWRGEIDNPDAPGGHTRGNA